MDSRLMLICSSGRIDNVFISCLLMPFIYSAYLMVDWKYIDGQKGVKEVLDRVNLRFIPLGCDAVAMTVKPPFWDVVGVEAPPQKEDAFKGLLWRRS